MSRPWWATALALFCASTVVFLAARDLLLPHVRDTEVWLGFELHGLAARLTAPLHWTIFALGAYGFWSLRAWVWPWASVYAFYVALSHLVWNVTSPAGGGLGQGLWQLGLLSVPAALLLLARPPGRALPPGISMRPARSDDASPLSELARRSKAHWGYPDSHLRLWRTDLTFTPASIAEQEVLVAERAGRIVGAVALTLDGTSADLEHLWVDPPAMGCGLGRRLFARAAERARALGAEQLVIDADPNAEGFYRRMGATRIGSVPSLPEGRELPRLVFRLV